MKLVCKLVVAAALAFSLTAMAQSSDSILNDEYTLTQKFIEAEVVRVSPLARTITLRGEKRGETRMFPVPEGTRISVNGREARLRDIRKGDSVLLAMKPTGQQATIARLSVPKTDKTLEQRRANPIVAAEIKPAVLPKTASNQPLILLFGLFALFTAAGIRAVRQ